MIVIVGYPDMIRLPEMVVTEAWGVEQTTCTIIFKFSIIVISYMSL